MTNPNAHTSCLSTAKNCTSGCCTSAGYCASIYSACYYQYYDFYTNSSYYFPQAYNTNCNTSARDCASGCCTAYGNCAASSSECYYRYGDFYTNPEYQFYGTPTYSLSCQLSARNCTSGCCTTSGNCAYTSSNCYYRYTDYYTNDDYYFSQTTPAYTYNVNCLSTARNCTSGCCKFYGACALTSSECYYTYSDYYTNSLYYYPGTSTTYNTNCLSTARYCSSGCCTSSGYCATTRSTCVYPYSDFYSNAYYYFSGDLTTPTTPNNPLYCVKGTQCYWDKLWTSIGIIVGPVLGYLLLFLVGILVFYCRKRAWVRAVNAFDTEDPWGNFNAPDGSGVPAQNSFRSGVVVNTNMPQPVFHYNKHYSGATVFPNNRVANFDESQQVIYSQLQIQPTYSPVKGGVVVVQG